MKRRHFLKSTPAAGRGSVSQLNRATTVVAGLLLGLFGAGGPATAQAQSRGSATSTPTASPDPGKVWLRIMAFADAPVVGAKVRVSVYGPYGWPLVDRHAATNQYGTFTAAVPSHLRSFRVTVSGGTINGQPFPGRLSRDVVLTDPVHQIVVINPVTTLVSRLLDRRPELDLEQAEARVRSFLGLPANYSLGLALRQSSGYVSRFFSPVAFMEEAQAAGGLEAFAHLLLQELLAADSATHLFRPPKLLGSTQSDAISIAQAGIEAGVLDYASNAGVGNLAGWAMATGGSLIFGSSSGDVDALVNALAALTSAIEDLANEVSMLNSVVVSTATKTQYDDITNFTTQYATAIQGHEQDLEYYAKACPPLTPDSPTTTPDPTCPTLYANLSDELKLEDDNKYYEEVENYVQDNGTLGTSGMPHLYSLWLGQSKAFFRPADSTKMQNLYDYWDSILTSAANLRMEYYHLNNYQDGPAGRGTLTDFMGDPSQNPPTTGTFQANEAANLKLMFPPVPEGTVISTVDHTMWSLLPWQERSSNIDYVMAAGCVSNNGPEVAEGAVGGPYYGFNDWVGATDAPPFGPTPGSIYAPTKSQWEAAVQLAPPLSSGTNWQQWLIAQTKTTGDESPASDGFFNILSCTNPPLAAWTMDEDNGSSFNYWTFHPDHDNFTTTATGNGAHNLIWPTRVLKSGEQYYWYQ